MMSWDKASLSCQIIALPMYVASCFLLVTDLLLHCYQQSKYTWRTVNLQTGSHTVLMFWPPVLTDSVAEVELYNTALYCTALQFTDVQGLHMTQIVSYKLQASDVVLYSGADMWKRCSHPAESVEFCIQRYFDMVSSKMVGSKRSDHWIGHHLEFQYGRHDETLNITILGSKWPVALKFGKQGYSDMLSSTVD